VEQVPVANLLMGGQQLMVQTESGAAVQSTAGGAEMVQKKGSGKRRQVSFACACCAHAKAKCDDKRPCSRCIRLHREELCVDVAVKKGQQEQEEAVAPTTEAKSVDTAGRKRASRIDKFQTRGFACQACWTAKVFCDRQRPCSRCAGRSLCCSDRPGVTPIDEESSKLVVAPAKAAAQEAANHMVPTAAALVGGKRKYDSEGFSSDGGSGHQSPCYEAMKGKGSVSPPECFTPPPCGASGGHVSVSEAVAKISANRAMAAPIDSPPLTKKARIPGAHIEELVLDGKHCFAAGEIAGPQPLPSPTQQLNKVLPSLSEVFAGMRGSRDLPVQLPGIGALNATKTISLPLPLPLPPLFRM